MFKKGTFCRYKKGGTCPQCPPGSDAYASNGKGSNTIKLNVKLLEWVTELYERKKCITSLVGPVITTTIHKIEVRASPENRNGCLVTASSKKGKKPF